MIYGRVRNTNNIISKIMIYKQAGRTRTSRENK
jgi:hypothetical protein